MMKMTDVTYKRRPNYIQVESEYRVGYAQNKSYKKYTSAIKKKKLYRKYSA